MADLSRVGLFKEPTYISIGDKYQDKKAIDSKLKGKNLTTSPSKGGQTNDAYFGQFSSLYVGERYAEPGHSDRKREKDEAKKIIGGAFRPSSPPKKAVGAGSLYGALNPPPDHVAETFKSWCATSQIYLSCWSFMICSPFKMRSPSILDV